MKITVKTFRETDKEHRHIKYYHNNIYLGYSMKEENEWVFATSCENIEYFRASTKKEILNILDKQINKKPVVLKQHFGIITKLNQ